jgi:cell wall-associated NlpC family hydrolase
MGLTAVVVVSGASTTSAAPPKSRAALVKAETVKLRSGPGTGHKATALLDAGRSARVVERDGEWVKLRLGTGTEGWVRSDLVAIAKKASRSADSHESPRPVARKRDRSESDDRSRSKPAPKVAVHAAKPAVKTAHASPLAPKKSAPKPVPVAVRSVTKPVEPIQVVRAVPTPAPEVEPEETLRETPEEPQADETPSPSVAPTPESRPAPAPARTNVVRSGRMIRTALSYRGTPYRMGGTGRGAFDCSGFVQFLAAREGKYLPRTAAEQFSCGVAVDRNALRPGDLVFFKNTYRRGISHVGMYIGNREFVHAASSQKGVRTDSIDSEHYRNHWAGARRLP